ncbi:MAG: hypothetical protein ACKPKO_06940, partial [Candidatus Fonsibacter sp.]
MGKLELAPGVAGPHWKCQFFSDVAAAAGTRRISGGKLSAARALAIALHCGTGLRAMGTKLSDWKQTPNK